MGGSVSTAESSQTDSDDVSPAARRRAALRPHTHTHHHGHPLHPSLLAHPHPTTTSLALVPRVSDLTKKEDKGIDKPDKPEKSRPTAIVATKSMRRSASTSGLSLVIHPAEDSILGGGAGSPCAGNTSSTNSSRDSSPCRDPPSPFALPNHSLIQASKPPIVVRRGPRGFGFTIHTVRVYYGDTDYYTMHHLVSAVSEQGAAWAAGLRAGDLITQLNGESVQGLLHTQVLRLLLAAPHATLRATPLDQTTIQAGGRRRTGGGRRAAAPPRPRPRRRCSLFRRISTKRATQEMHQMVSSGECVSSASPSPAAAPASPAADSPLHTTATTHYQRPSSLHGLKHKLVGGVSVVAGVSVPGAEVRRASLQHMPLSPLARTPSPSPQPPPQPASPTRLHPRSAEAKCSISPLCCGGVGGAVGVGVGVGGGGSRRGVVWRAPAPAPPTPPPQDKPDEPPLPRIAEEKDSPTHHARNLPNRTPAKQSTPTIFTSSPKPSVEKCAFDASTSFASLSLSDESYVADTSADISNMDTSRELFMDDSRTSTEPSILIDDKFKKPAATEPSPTAEPQPKVRKKSDSSLKDEELKTKLKKQDKPELKKQDSIKKVEVKEEKLEVKQEEKKVDKVMERAGSIKKVEKEKEKEAKKQEKAEKKQERTEAKRTDSLKKIEVVKRQESVDTNKSPEAVEAGSSEGRSKNSMVSKLLGVMGRKGTRDHDDDKPTKKNDKQPKKKGGSQPLPTQPPPKPEPPQPTIDKDCDDKKKKGRGRVSSSSSGEK